MRNGVNVLLAAAVVAVLLLAISSVYSTYVTSTNHHAACVRSNLVLDTLHDVIVIAFTPPPGSKLTASQVDQIEAFEAKAFARIDSARC